MYVLSCNSIKQCINIEFFICLPNCKVIIMLNIISRYVVEYILFRTEPRASISLKKFKYVKIYYICYVPGVPQSNDGHVTHLTIINTSNHNKPYQSSA